MNNEKIANFLNISARSYYDWRNTYPNVCFFLETIFKKDEDFELYMEFNFLPFSGNEKISILKDKPASHLDNKLVARLLNIKEHSISHWRKKRIELFDLIDRVFFDDYLLENFLNSIYEVQAKYANENWKYKIEKLNRLNLFNNIVDTGILKKCSDFINKINSAPSLNILKYIKDEDSDMNYKFKLEDYFLSSLPFNSDNKFEAKKNIDTKTELLTNPLFNKFDINDFLLLGEKIKNYDTQELNDFFKIKISDLYIYAISINDIKLFSNLLILRGGRSILFKIFKYYIDPLKEKINKDEYINFTKERKKLMFNIYINYIHPSNFFNLLSKTTGLSYLETRELYGEKDSFKKIIA